MKNYDSFFIENFDINEKIFIIAELSANHGGDINIAKKSILMAKEAGASAVKIQTYTADTMTIDCDNEYFTLNAGTVWDGMTYYELYKKAYTPWEWHKELFDYAKEIGIMIFSTPFDFTSVDFLEELGVPCYKVASFEMMDIPLISYIAKKGKPIIISTGIATFSEIEDAYNACIKEGNDKVIFLKCTSDYPADIVDANLNTMVDIKEKLNTIVGVSDHSKQNIVPIVSVGLGARVIEKHFIIDKKIGGADSSFSLTIEEFSDMVKNVRLAELSLGKVTYEITEKKAKNRKIGRSLFIVEDIKCGETFTDENIRSIRPSDGLEPKYYYDVLGKKSTTNLKRGTPLKTIHVEGL